MKITVCVICPRYPDSTEPLGRFVESEETARKIDDWWRAQPGEMIGTWEDFEVEIDSRDQILYGVFGLRDKMCAFRRVALRLFD